MMQKNSQRNNDMRINNTKNMILVFQKFKNMQLLSGKQVDSPEVIYIMKKIKEFENDLLVLNTNH